MKSDLRYTWDRPDHTWARPEADMFIPDFFHNYHVCTDLIQICTAKKEICYSTDIDLKFVRNFDVQI